MVRRGTRRQVPDLEHCTAKGTSRPKPSEALDDLWRLWKGRCRAHNEVSAGLPGRWRVMRIKSLSAALCGVAMVGALALPASAADAETGYRYASR